ncbi:MAG: hypothetical protein JSU00_00885 [Acidobacteria bacterium]|nr:hypothetical protein [Acidobacteriota bacterium]
MQGPRLRANIHLESNGTANGRFRTGVSLHSHTQHSREPLSFIYRVTGKLAPVRWAVAGFERRYREAYGTNLDLNRAYWTPPLSAHDAWRLESGEIEQRLGLASLVSLTDHDSIDAAMTLRVLDSFHHLPVSVEWTVPFRGTFFHLGIHNLPPERARAVMTEFERFTASPVESELAGLLEAATSNPAVLAVFNHPCWDENEIGHREHVALAHQFCLRYGAYLHAVELNGLRPWKENRETMALSEAVGKPLISGGDRHGLEPNATLNLTNARTFAEFVEEMREGASHVLFTTHYFEPLPVRMLRGVQDALADHERGGRWCDRVFYISDDGEHLPVHRYWKRRPLTVRAFETGLFALRHPGLRMAFRAFARQEAIS